MGKATNAVRDAATKVVTEAVAVIYAILTVTNVRTANIGGTNFIIVEGAIHADDGEDVSAYYSSLMMAIGTDKEKEYARAKLCPYAEVGDNAPPAEVKAGLRGKQIRIRTPTPEELVKAAQAKAEMSKARKRWRVISADEDHDF